MRTKGILLTGAFLIAACTALSAQTGVTSPDGLVKDLYRVHKLKHGPFFKLAAARSSISISKRAWPI